MNSLTKRYVISKDASEVIDLLRFLSIVFVVLIHNTPVVPSRISFFFRDGTVVLRFDEAYHP